MSLQIDFDGFWDWSTKKSIESALRECIGDPPRDEEWNVALTSYGGYCIVLAKTTQQTRRKMFFLRPSELAEVIPMWLKEYPLR